MPAVRLHRCAYTLLPGSVDACSRVQDALEDAGVEYEVVKEPYFPKSRRTRVEALSGQRLMPVIEFEDGSAYRDESRRMAEEIRARRLFERAGARAG